jgi:hypothetical protein
LRSNCTLLAITKLSKETIFKEMGVRVDYYDYPEIYSIQKLGMVHKVWQHNIHFSQFLMECNILHAEQDLRLSFLVNPFLPSSLLQNARMFSGTEKKVLYISLIGESNDFFSNEENDE